MGAPPGHQQHRPPTKCGLGPRPRTDRQPTTAGRRRSPPAIAGEIFRRKIFRIGPCLGTPKERCPAQSTPFVPPVVYVGRGNETTLGYRWRGENSVMTHGGRSITVLWQANGEHSWEYLLVRRPSFPWVSLGGALALSECCPIASPLRCHGAAWALSGRCLSNLSGLRACFLGDAHALPGQVHSWPWLCWAGK